ncbi:MAG: hypothetical protein ABH891_04660 [Candidatus Omnitrophota bacterium]
MKKCPFCGEEVKEEPPVCRLCHFDLKTGKIVNFIDPIVKSAPFPKPVKKRKRKRKDVRVGIKIGFGIFVLLPLGLLSSWFLFTFQSAPQELNSQYQIFLVAASKVISLLTGLVPFWIAKNKGRTRLAKSSFWICVALALTGGAVFAWPGAAILTVIALAAKKPKKTKGRLLGKTMAREALIFLGVMFVIFIYMFVIEEFVLNGMDTKILRIENEYSLRHFYSYETSKYIISPRDIDTDLNGTPGAKPPDFVNELQFLLSSRRFLEDDVGKLLFFSYLLYLLVRVVIRAIKKSRTK